MDEAHRTQYKDLAENMRAGLEERAVSRLYRHAAAGRERKTNQWFGDYVSEYNFQQSVDDGATVPLFYEKRVPQVLIQNDDLSEEFYRDSAKTRISTTRSRRSWRTGSRRRSKSSSATTGWRRSPRTSSITSRGAATSAKAWWSRWTSSPP